MSVIIAEGLLVEGWSRSGAASRRRPRQGPNGRGRPAARGLKLFRRSSVEKEVTSR